MRRVVWRSRITGYRGCGEWMTASLAEAWRERGEREWGRDISHWTEGRLGS